MGLYVPGGTENTIKDTYLRQFWSQSCGYSGWCGAYQTYAPPGWHADPAFKETGYCCGGHGGCPTCYMTLSQAIADYQTEITFMSARPGAQIFIDGVEWWPGAITAADGATFRGISPGTHTYELRMAGYQSETGTFELAINTPVTVPLPAGNASFSSTPPDAEIFIDGADQGVKTPNTATNMPAGTHAYVLKLAGYNDYSGTVSVVSGQTVAVTATMIVACFPVWTCDIPLTGIESDGCGNRRPNPVCNPPQTGSISFVSTPAGAAIFLDGHDQGAITPNIVSGIPAGTHAYTLRLPRYNDNTGSTDVTLNQTASVTVTMIAACTPVWKCEIPLTGTEADGCGNRRPNPACNPTQTGSISFVSTPAGSEIFIDGADQNIKTPATISDIPVGTHTYTLKQTGYNDVTGTANVGLNQTAVASATMIASCTPVWTCDIPLTGIEADGCGNRRPNPACNPAPPAQTTGSISFVTSPPGAEIFIDGQDQGAVTPYTISGIPAGDHTYTLKLPGYNDITGTASVISNQTASVPETLIPAEGCVYFSSTPQGARIFIDNMEQVGKTTPALICGLTIGLHTYRISSEGYRDITGSINTVAGQGTSVTSIPQKKSIGAGTIFAMGLLGAVLGAVILGSGTKTTIVARPPGGHNG